MVSGGTEDNNIAEKSNMNPANRNYAKIICVSLIF